MIRLTPDTKLAIVLPGTNKALTEAIKSATAEQLMELNEGKDLKSLINSVLQDKVTSSKSDQVLGDLLKNAPIFKNMGSFPDTLQTLVTQLKTDLPDSPQIAVLEKFFQHVAKADAALLQAQISDSGLFMESKIASLVLALPRFKESLGELHTLLAKSADPQAKALAETIRSLIDAPALQHAAEDPKAAKEVAQNITKIAAALSSLTAKNDVLYSKDVVNLSDKLLAIAVREESRNTPASAPALKQEVKPLLTQLYTLLLSSKTAAADPLLDRIEALMRSLSKELPEPQIKNEIASLTQTLKETFEKADPLTSKALPPLIDKLSAFKQPEHFHPLSQIDSVLQDDLKSSLLRLGDELQNTSVPQELHDNVDKLLTQIDYHQLLSGLSGATSIFFPFQWDLLEEGSVAFKKPAPDKFYCEINLRLKEFGEIDLMMALYESNQLEIQAHTETEAFKELLQENLPQLRSLLIDAGLTPRRIRILQMKENTSPSEAYHVQGIEPDLGFEVKG